MHNKVIGEIISNFKVTNETDNILIYEYIYEHISIKVILRNGEILYLQSFIPLLILVQYN